MHAEEGLRPKTNFFSKKKPNSLRKMIFIYFEESKYPSEFFFCKSEFLYYVNDHDKKIIAFVHLAYRIHVQYLVW